MIGRFWKCLLSAATVFLIDPAFGQNISQFEIDQVSDRLESLSSQDREALLSELGSTGGARVIEPDILLPTESTQVVKQIEEEEEPPIKSETAGDDEDLLRFGEKIFSSSVSTFAPVDDVPIPADYVLGVGDQLVIQLFGKVNRTFSLEINRQGEINFPQLGSLSLTGLSFEAAKEIIDTKVRQQIIGVEAAITLGKLRSIGIFIAGEVKVPGAYTVSALTSVSQALFQAGGISSIGSMRQIQVLRSGRTISSFDVYDLLMSGDNSGDIRLQSGDVVFVPVVEKEVSVYGEVRRPKIYEIRDDATIEDLILMAGGLTSKAYASSATLTRRLPESGLPRAMDLNLQTSEGLNVALEDGDQLRIREKGERVLASISISGAVARPGMYGWESGDRISDLFRDVQVDLLKGADLDYSLIVSDRLLTQALEVRTFSLADALDSPGTAADPLLRDNDEVLVFFNPEFVGENNEDRRKILEPLLDKLKINSSPSRPLPIVTISGGVKAPGEYPLTLDASVMNAIDAAGGLKQLAQLEDVELSRLVKGRDGFEYEAISLRQAVDEEMLGIKLKSRDVLNFRLVEDVNKLPNIVIEGEVQFPGIYTVSSGETLANILDRAGGLTSDAFSLGAVLTRESIRQAQQEGAKTLASDLRRDYVARLQTSENITLEYSELAEVLQELESYEAEGRLLISLDSSGQGLNSAEIRPRAGDKLFVPKKVNTVSVVGEVARPATHQYQPGFGLMDYLKLSGGVGDRGDTEGIYIARANGQIINLEKSLWSFGTLGSQEVAVGDTIVVPVSSDYKDNLDYWTDITRVIYEGLVSIAVVKNL